MITLDTILPLLAVPDTLVKFLREHGYAHASIDTLAEIVDSIESQADAIPDDARDSEILGARNDARDGYTRAINELVDKFFRPDGAPKSVRSPATGKWCAWYEVNDNLDYASQYLSRNIIKDKDYAQGMDSVDIHEAQSILESAALARANERNAKRAIKADAKNAPMPEDKPVPSYDGALINAIPAEIRPAGNGSKVSISATVRDASSIAITFGPIKEFLTGQKGHWSTGKPSYRYSGKSFSGQATQTRTGMWYVQMWVK